MKYASRAAMTAGCLALTLFGVSRAALADGIAFDRDLKGADAYTGLYNGGEFKVTTYDCPGPDIAAQGHGVNLGGVFQTFCLERNEFLKFDGTLYDCALNSGAIEGGLGWDGNGGPGSDGPDANGGPGFDPLSCQTAYLFDKFWHGTLAGYDYTPGEGNRTDSATSLQLAIWYLEDELGAQLLAIYNADAVATGWVAAANAHCATELHNDIGNVRVVNVSLRGEARQDVLVVISAVPLPPAALLGFGLMSAVGALDFVRRRRRALA